MYVDPTILSLAKQGDEAAFELLVKQHQNLVYTLSLRMLANPDDALDASQEVFIRVWRTLPAFEGRSEFSTWLYRVTANICLDNLKKRGRHREHCSSLEEDESLEPRASSVFPIEEELDRLELNEHVNQVLWKMNANYRAALVLRDIYGFSYEEVSEILRISLAAAKIRIYRARLDFKSRYRQMGGRKEEK